MTDLFKDIVPSILHNKKDLSKEEDFDRSYNAFIVNKALSYYIDTILQANEMNLYPNLPANVQYRFLLNSVRGYKRPFRKWDKRETIENLEAIKEYYNYSNSKAKEALVLLDATQIDEIKKKLNKGGINDSRSKRVHRSKAT